MTPSSVADWHHDPLEVDRFLDGEVDAAERARRERDLARDPVLAVRVSRRRAFLAALADPDALRAATTLGVTPETVRSLESRIRSGILSESGSRGRGRRPRLRLVVPLAAAALIVVALGAGLFGGGGRVEAMPPGARLAVELVRDRDSARGPAALGAPCDSQHLTSPWRFPLVESNELTVGQCRDEGDGRAHTRAVLYRPEDLEILGYVAVPEPGVAPSHEIGVTRLRDVVVFDVRLQGAIYYLATPRAVVDRRGSCAACHGRSREGQSNPHPFFERRPP